MYHGYCIYAKLLIGIYYNSLTYFFCNGFIITLINVDWVGMLIYDVMFYDCL